MQIVRENETIFYRQNISDLTILAWEMYNAQVFKRESIDKTPYYLDGCMQRMFVKGLEDIILLMRAWSGW